MFQNEPPIDFSLEESRGLFRKALESVQNKISSGGYCSFPIIAGEKVKTGNVVESRDPAEAEVVIGYVHFANKSHAQNALKFLDDNGRKWQGAAFESRVENITKAASIMRSRRLLLAALIVREAGKPWKEADADVCEAIDFCEYYAAQMARLGPVQRLVKVPGEDNFYGYRPRGVAVVIAPWNFPLAIACGMTVASLVCGNPTILKPAEQTSIIAYEFAQILIEAGVPNYAFSFLPGRGEEVGALLVDHPETSLICFTGSKDVGLQILRKASVIVPGQNHLKRVILEMGGKNCIIIDEDADLDEAIKGVVYSAFGYSGQKCSACSRVLAVGDIYEPFLARLKEAVSDIIIGRPSEAATLVGPLIDAESQARVNAVIRDAEETQQVLYKVPKIPAEGHFVGPTVFRDVDASHSIWTDEIFGPVLACRHAGSFSLALREANDCQYALTGGVYSRSPAHIQQAIHEFSVGNLYINRGCTGALVCRHPFGGFKLSGVGSKAGGPDYLLQFMEPFAVSENTMRRGFAPDAE